MTVITRRQLAIFLSPIALALVVFGVKTIEADQPPAYSRPNRPVAATTPEEEAAWAEANGPVNFTKKDLQNEISSSPTSLQFGPDGKLYVAEVYGDIHIYTIARDAAGVYSVIATETINLIKNIPNHDDDGVVRAETPTTRQVTGLLVAGTPSNPILFVSSSDPRIGGNSSGTDKNLDTNSGIISRLTQATPGTWTGAVKLDLVRGLPRSEENHASNGMQLSADGLTLYLVQGGHTNMGAPSNNFAKTPEFALSGAILAIDLAAIGETTYDLPTLDDPTRGGGGQPAENDPFGGNDGLNQAKLVAGGPVQIHAPGFRNAFDLLIASDGRMFTIDNGPNNTWGGVPIGEGPAGNCTNGLNESGTATQWDSLHYVNAAGYYGGHPNPVRGNPDGIFTPEADSPVPFAMTNGVECDYRDVGPDLGAGQDGSLTSWSNSTNGLVEYTASNFGGDMQGDLLAAGWNSQKIFRVSITYTNGITPVLDLNTTLFSSVGGNPLDITIQGDGGLFPGTIWVASLYSGGLIRVYEPADYGGTTPPACSAVYDIGLDEDSDTYTNADELDNSTDPCNGGDFPPDNDGDGLSDLNDDDDDNDGLLDKNDSFAIDDMNGTSTTLPVVYTWDNGAPVAGGILNTGFTGLMQNGIDNYQDLYDEVNMTAGGAAGVLTIDDVPAGDALAGTNNQAYGFQFGVDVSGETIPFSAHTQILNPFSGFTPADDQSMGLFFGTGDQDNYIKIVVAANGGAGGIVVASEVVGSVSSTTYGPAAGAAVLGAATVDLYLTIDPVANLVQPAIAVDGGTVQNLGPALVVPAGWLAGPNALAVGILSTSAGPAAPEFPASWSLIEVTVPGGTWTPLTPTVDATARHEDAFTFVAGNFYLLGGRGIKPVQQYDPTGNSWANLAQTPVQMHHFQAVPFNNLVYILGAYSGSYPYETNIDHVYIYDPTADRWITGPDIPAGRRRGSAGAVVYQDAIYLVGGIYGGHGAQATAVTWLDRFDPATNTWTTLADAPRARDHFQAVVIGDKLYAAGGRDTGEADFFNNTIGPVDVYDFNTGLWSTLPSPGSDIPTKRAGTTTVALGSELLVIGGEGAGQAYTETEALDTNTNTWRALSPLNQARHGTQAALCGGDIFIAGGSGNQGGSPELTNLERFSLLGQGACPGATHPATVTPDQSSLDFGPVGTNVTATVPITVSHSGTTGDPDIVIAGVVVVGRDAGYFGVTFPAGAREALATLAPGESITLDVSFSPGTETSYGGDMAALAIVHDGAGGVITVPLSGTGAAPTVITAQAGPIATIPQRWWTLALLILVAVTSGAVLRSRLLRGRRSVVG